MKRTIITTALAAGLIALSAPAFAIDSASAEGAYDASAGAAPQTLMFGASDHAEQVGMSAEAIYDAGYGTGQRTSAAVRRMTVDPTLGGEQRS